MANSLASVAPRILAQGMMALRQFCVMPRLVNSDYSMLAMQKGQTVDVPVPSSIAAIDVTPATYAPAASDVAPTYVPITLNNWKEAPFALTDKDLKDAFDGIIPMQASEAVKTIANAVNASIFATYQGIYGYAGTAGTTPFASDTSAATAVRKILNLQAAPLSDRRIVLDVSAEANALGLPAFQYYLNTGNTSVITEGQLGRKLGMDFYVDQQVPTQTAGTITTGLTAKAATAQAVGTTSVICTTAASTGACALLKGDIIQFAGDSNTYVLTANATQAAASTDVTLQLSHGTVNPGIQVALSGGQAVTVKASHVVNLAFNKYAIGFANRAFDDVYNDNGNIVVTQQDPVSGLVMRLEISRQYKQTRFSFDMLWGVSLIRPELACRLAG